jgi:hypothetical protein
MKTRDLRRALPPRLPERLDVLDLVIAIRRPHGPHVASLDIISSPSNERPAYGFR